MIKILFFIFLASTLSAQSNSVISGVYKWNDLKVEKTETFEKRQVLEGSTTDNENLNIYALTIKPGKSLEEKSDDETLIIIKEGNVKVFFKNDNKILIPGSIALFMSGDNYKIENSVNEDAVFYVFLYRSNYSLDTERGINYGGSFMLHWNDLVFKPHDKGGIRQYFERPTSMSKRFEMHVTTLNQGLKSHDPHTHIAEEIVLMINGNSEMQIGDNFYKGSEGDLFFLGSNIPHAIRNEGTSSCMYFAIQWE